MNDLGSKIHICPICGRELIEINDAKGKLLFKLCLSSNCRTVINISNEYTIDKLELDKFSKVTSGINKEKKSHNIFMLLKENLSGPLLQKVTNSYSEKDKTMYCITQANSKEDAITKFQRKFNVIKITSEMVVPISIKEEE